MDNNLASTATALIAGLAVGILLGYCVSVTILPRFFTTEQVDITTHKKKKDGPQSQQPQQPQQPSQPRIQVIVVGDIGRSPRMQYHALSIARHGRTVDLVGYLDSPLHPNLQGNKNVHVHPLPLPPKFINTLPFYIAGPLKVIQQTIALGSAIFRASPPSGPEWIIIQNPPSIPVLHVAYAASVFLGSKVIIDWHNYGWSILATTRGPNHPFVRIYRTYEQYWGRAAAAANLTVTDAMAEELRSAPFDITTPIHTLHDRPAAHLQPILNPAERHATLKRLEPTRAQADAIMSGTTRLLVSSTSWTPDEDFQMLLDALMTYTSLYSGYQRKPNPSNQIPKVLIVITGRGPQKSKYETLVHDLTQQGRLSGVTIMTAWLSTQDYASLLAVADLGVCLHTSSSGVDLPMKVVDMFGAGIPVVAYDDYKSFSELVKEGVNGHGFSTVPELAKILTRLLTCGGKKELVRLKAGAVKEGMLRWDEEWDRVVAKQLGL